MAQQRSRKRRRNQVPEAMEFRCCKCGTRQFGVIANGAINDDQVALVLECTNGHRTCMWIGVCGNPECLGLHFVSSHDQEQVDRMHLAIADNVLRSADDGDESIYQALSRLTPAWVRRRLAYVLMPYKDYLKTDHWQEIRRDALARALWRCQMCGKHSDDGSLHVHHRSYRSRGFESPEDVVVVCAGCHKNFHDHRYLSDAIEAET